MSHQTDLPLASHGKIGSAPLLLRIGGSLGIAGAIIGSAIFLTACAGADAVFSLSLIPIALAGPGLVISLISGICEKSSPYAEDTHILAALFVNAVVIMGGLMEMAVWLNWKVFPSAG